MSNIILIHSGDRDLSFLKPFVDFLQFFFGDKLKKYNLDVTLESHLLAQKDIENASDNTLIILLCHGGSNYVLGNKDIEELGVNEDHFEFLSGKNISIIRNKKVICLSCNSRDGLGKLVVNNDGIGIIGFGDIKFDDPKFLHRGEKTSNDIQESSQEAMISVLTETLKISYKMNATLSDFVNYFKLIANKHCDKLILGNKGDDSSLRVANFLWYLKYEMTFFGDGECKLFE